MTGPTTNSIRQKLWKYHPSAFLLAAQLIMLVLYAFASGSHVGRTLISAVGTLVLMLVVWAVIRSPAMNWVAWVLAIPAFLLTIISVFVTHPSLVGISSLFEGVLYFYAAGSMIAYMMSDASVTVDELFAAGSTFTLFAWGYAHFYLAVQAWMPGSFFSSTDPNQTRSFIELLFLSFTNLSATGLSDINPVTNPARVLAMLEQFTGVGYVAVVVSRLIGLSLNNRKNG